MQLARDLKNFPSDEPESKKQQNGLLTSATLWRLLHGEPRYVKTVRGYQQNKMPFFYELPSMHSNQPPPFLFSILPSYRRKEEIPPTRQFSTNTCCL